MRLLRPQSLSSLVLLALAIIGLPLIAALVIAGLQLRQLAAESERIVADAVAVTRVNQRYFAQLGEAERRRLPALC